MKYITRVIEYTPKADNLARKVEEVVNKAYQEEGLILVTFSVTGSAKAVLVFTTNL